MEEIIAGINRFFEDNGTKILQALAVVVVGYILIKLLMILFGRLLKRTKIDPIIQPYIRSAIKFIAYILLFISVAGLLGLSMTSLVTLLGTAGLAFSLSLQNSLSNMINGIFIMLSKPFQKGDLVNISGVEGLVEGIGLVYTKIRTVDREILIPNSEVASAKITDVSVMPDRRYDAKFTICYDEDIDRVRAVTLAAIKKSGMSVEGTDPVVAVDGFGQLGLNMVARIWVKNDDYWTFNNFFYEELKKSFDRENISIPHTVVGFAVGDKGK